MPGPGRRFEPGNRANPAGRPRVGTSLAEAIRERAGQDGGLLLDRVFAVAGGADARLALEATKLLFVYGFGKPVEVQMALSPDRLADLSDSDLEVALKVAQRLAGGA